MKKLLATLAFSAAAALPLGTLAAPVLSITPAIKAVAVGDTFIMTVSISGLPAAGEIVSAFDLNVLFNGSFLSNTAVNFFPASFGGNANIDATSTLGAGNTGTLLNSFLSDADLALLQTGSPLNLFTLSFTALAIGDTFLNFGPSPDFDRLVVGRNANALVLDYVGACVSVGASAPGTGCQNTVPEPASYGLVMLALLAGGAASLSGARAARPRA